MFSTDTIPGAGELLNDERATVEPIVIATDGSNHPSLRFFRRYT